MQTAKFIRGLKTEKKIRMETLVVVSCFLFPGMLVTVAHVVLFTVN